VIEAGNMARKLGEALLLTERCSMTGQTLRPSGAVSEHRDGTVV
jgi:hypothetical protein